MWERPRVDGKLKLKYNAMPTLFNEEGNLFFCLIFFIIINIIVINKEYENSDSNLFIYLFVIFFIIHARTHARTYILTI